MLSQIIELILYASMTVIFFMVDKQYQFSTALLRRNPRSARRQQFGK
jgi:hypothetical protein